MNIAKSSCRVNSGAHYVVSTTVSGNLLRCHGSNTRRIDFMPVSRNRTLTALTVSNIASDPSLLLRLAVASPCCIL
jgi:hypothetical protein